MININGKTEKTYNANYIHWECTAPVPKQELVTVPLRDGYINLTSMLSPEVHYDPRTLTIGLELRSLREDWPMYWSQILKDLHGQEVTVARSEDPNWFWIGTASVGPLEDHGATAGVTITVNAQPFKRTAAWKHAESVNLSGDVTIDINVPYLRGYPEFECSTANNTVTYEGETWTLPAGVSTVNGLYFSVGENELALHGSGTVKVRYRGGTL